jgi:hypothetical protein
VRVPLAVLAVLLVTAVSACGGGSDGGDRLTAEDFRDQANAICKNIAETDVEEASGPDDVGRFVDDQIEVLEDGADAFHALAPPEELDDEWDDYLELVDSAVDRMQELGDDVDGASDDEVAELGQDFVADLSGIEGRASALEEELELDECNS